MNAAKFQQLLKDLEACLQARYWAKGKTFAKAWATCNRGYWMLWLCSRMVGKKGWPTRKQVNATYDTVAFEPDSKKADICREMLGVPRR